MTDRTQTPTEPFFLIVADLETGVFCIEGPMTDDAPWNLAAGRARETGQRIQCGPRGLDRTQLAAEYRQAHKFAGVPPGSIVRPRG
jgi:hypothetical protein